MSENETSLSEESGPTEETAGEPAEDTPASESLAASAAEAPIPPGAQMIAESMQAIMQRRMPTLEYAHDRFVRAAQAALVNLVRVNVELVAEPVRLRTFGEVARQHAGRPHVTLVKVNPLRGQACWVADPTAVYAVVDTMFGGDSRIPVAQQDRERSATELRILRRMMDALREEYEKAWKPVFELGFEFLREESEFERVDIAAPNDIVLQSRFVVRINGHEGFIDFCVPYWLLEPIKHLLYQPSQKLQTEIDRHWTSRLETEVQSAEIEMVVVLAQEEMRIADVLALNVGDIVPIEVLEPVTAYVDGLPMVLGQYGVRNGRYALKVAHVKHPADLLGKR